MEIKNETKWSQIYLKVFEFKKLFDKDRARFC
jgi:hypothetical protein